MFLVRLKKIIKENITSLSLSHTSDLSTQGPKYSSGPCADWDVKPKFIDLGLSLATLGIEEPRSGIVNTYSTLHFVVERVSCSIFKEAYEDKDDNQSELMLYFYFYVSMSIVHSLIHCTCSVIRKD